MDSARKLMNLISKIGIIAGFSVTLMTAPVLAAEGEDLLKGKDCLACHKVDTKAVGPSYKDVAAKYKGNAEAQANLVAKIKKGGSGNWGPIPMPPHPAVSDDELNKIVAWILSL